MLAEGESVGRTRSCVPHSAVSTPVLDGAIRAATCAAVWRAVAQLEAPAPAATCAAPCRVIESKGSRTFCDGTAQVIENVPPALLR